MKDYLPLILLVLMALLWSLLIGGCVTTKKSGAPLTSLCILDFEAQRCWVNKSEGKGPTFSELKSDQERCVGDSEFPCWYGINSADLKRIINK